MAPSCPVRFAPFLSCPSPFSGRLDSPFFSFFGSPFFSSGAFLLDGRSVSFLRRVVGSIGLSLAVFLAGHLLRIAAFSPLAAGRILVTGLIAGFALLSTLLARPRLLVRLLIAFFARVTLPFFRVLLLHRFGPAGFLLAVRAAFGPVRIAPFALLTVAIA